MGPPLHLSLLGGHMGPPLHLSLLGGHMGLPLHPSLLGGHMGPPLLGENKKKAALNNEGRLPWICLGLFYIIPALQIRKNGTLWFRVSVRAIRYLTCYAANGYRAATDLTRSSAQADGSHCSATLGGCDLRHPIGDGDGAAVS